MAIKFTKEQLLNKKIVDYSFTIAFFSIFSFFIFFAIKPNLETAFILQKELDELKQVDINYEAAIDKIIEIQSSLESTRKDEPLLYQALPSKPNLDGMLKDILKSASSSGILITELNIDEVPIKGENSNRNIKKYGVSFQSESDFNRIQNFMSSFISQRRLKLVNELDITKVIKESSASAQVNVAFKIEGFYL